ncbi:MAG: hypothetical protein A3F16_03805 [Deltaproteobacteria bacterium RIFCSPHIGHO2_12_FULL_43_9]|nr:MAG: hypothetical protein A3F16_03805 [Deltaproteobacteria bacterium RIFCSPHIGHO2_12_FULL_43_9]
MTAGEISKIISGKLLADPDLRLTGFCEPREVDSTSFCFIMKKESLREIEGKSAGLVIIPADYEQLISVPSIVVENLAVALAKLLSKLFPLARSSGIIHQRAIISESAKVGANVEIGAGSVIGEDVDIGDNTIILQNVVIGDKTRVGKNCKIYSSVSIYHGCAIGNSVIIHSGAVIGADGFGYTRGDTGILKIEQIGNVIIEDNVEIGANSCIDRATIGSTKIGFGTKIDNQVQIGHNCKIGRFNIICGQAGLAGSVMSGTGVTFAGQVGVGDHLKIGDGATLGPTTQLAVDVEPGQTILGEKGYPARVYLRKLFLLEKLPEYVKRLKALENEISKKSQDLPPEKALDH